MSSDFEDAFEDADEGLFDEFGEDAVFIGDQGEPQRNVTVVLMRNISAAGADGMVVVIELAADLRIKEVPKAYRGCTLRFGDRLYRLDDHLGSDGLVNRFSLLRV
ncbi:MULTISPECIES: head-tail joining protein [unclassified Pseudomonas]|uniref:head-tail joining protein n=1 Tax=unclassified Pseudomonas TaxID=196821 RepID=UPI001C60F921|nr:MULTISPECIES: hypothetical protein [unclassified Pseudomonas]MBW5416114.1 hypothetical protein [Pseudomonas sp. MAG002Y]